MKNPSAILRYPLAATKPSVLLMYVRFRLGLLLVLLIGGCVVEHEPELGEIATEINGTCPGYVTTFERLFSAGVTPTTVPGCANRVVARATSVTTSRLHAGGRHAYGTYAVVGFEGSSTAYFPAVDLCNLTSLVVFPAVFRQFGQTGNAGATE